MDVAFSLSVEFYGQVFGKEARGTTGVCVRERGGWGGGEREGGRGRERI